MKHMNMFKKYGSKVAFVSVAALPVIASANGDSGSALQNLGTQLAAGISGLITVISAIGLAGVAVVVAAKGVSVGYQAIKKI